MVLERDILRFTVKGYKMQIRPFNASDGQAWHAWYHDERLAHYFRGYTQGVTLEQCCNAPYLMKANILVGIDADGNRVGAVSLADTDRIIRIYRFGLLVDPGFQGFGYGKDLTEGALNWAFGTMNAHKVYGEILEKDSRIIGGSFLAGFEIEGVKKKSVYLNGEYHNEVVISILREDYYGSRKRQSGDAEHNDAAGGGSGPCGGECLGDGAGASVADGAHG